MSFRFRHWIWQLVLEAIVAIPLQMHSQHRAGRPGLLKKGLAFFQPERVRQHARPERVEHCLGLFPHDSPKVCARQSIMFVKAKRDLMEVAEEAGIDDE